jgi:hypothetical protein
MNALQIVALRAQLCERHITVEEDGTLIIRLRHYEKVIVGGNVPHTVLKKDEEAEIVEIYISHLAKTV